MPVNRLNLSALRALGVTTPARVIPIPIPFGPGHGKLGVVQGLSLIHI